MLSWKQNAFKILVIGGPDGIITKVEKRIGREINFLLDVKKLTFEEALEIIDRLLEADLIFVEFSHQTQFKDLIQASIQYPDGFVPSIGFRMNDDDNMEFWP
jgi:hypothetical protein